jgi:cell shape-determining protein MreD
MSELVKNIVRFAVFILVQVYVLFKVPHLHRFITPYLYYLFILWLPFATPRFWLLVIGFLTGLSLDYFTQSPGLHAAACGLIAYIRPFVINLLLPKDSSEFNYREPSPRTLGWTPYGVYVLILTVFHHAYLLFLEWLSFGSLFTFLFKLIATTAVSMLLVFTTELLFPRKLRYRTNTA